MKKKHIAAVLVVFATVRLAGQEWVVPADRRGKMSTFGFNEETRSAGEQLYSVNCKSCHGTPGRANFISLVPPPGDPATEKIQKNSDGEIYYKVSEGRNQMPSFKNIMTSKDIWNVISFIRSFNKAYKQEVMAVITSAAYPGSEIRIKLFHTEGDSLITLKAEAVNETQVLPVEGAGVKLFVHRTFGMLPIDEEKTTGVAGFAFFRIPDDLPGDSEGNIRVSARFTNEDIFGSAGKDTTLNAGIVIHPVSLVAGRAMWNSVRKAPVWIIISFTGGLLVVWGFIIVVLLKLRDIFIIGGSLSKTKLNSSD